VLAGSSGQRRITAGEKDEMVEVGACEAEGSFPLHSKKASLPEFNPAFRTCRIADDPEDDNVTRIRTELTAARWTCVRCRFHIRPICDCLLTPASPAAAGRPVQAKLGTLNAQSL